MDTVSDQPLTPNMVVGGCFSIDLKLGYSKLISCFPSTSYMRAGGEVIP